MKICIFHSYDNKLYIDMVHPKQDFKLNKLDNELDEKKQSIIMYNKLEEKEMVEKK